jgi:hypothetical protein
MGTHDNLDRGDGEQVRESASLLSEEAAAEPKPIKELPRTTTGVIRIMRARGRAEVAALVEELHVTEKRVEETTIRAKDILRLLRTLHRKATDAYPKITPSDPVEQV